MLVQQALCPWSHLSKPIDWKSTFALMKRVKFANRGLWVLKDHEAGMNGKELR